MPLPKIKDLRAATVAERKREDAAAKARLEEATRAVQARRGAMLAQLVSKVDKAVNSNMASGHTSVTLWGPWRPGNVESNDYARTHPSEYAEMNAWKSLGQEWARQAGKGGYKVKVGIVESTLMVRVVLELSWSTR